MHLQLTFILTWVHGSVALSTFVLLCSRHHRGLQDTSPSQTEPFSLSQRHPPQLLGTTSTFGLCEFDRCRCFSDGTVVENPPANAGDAGDVGT